MPELSLSFDQQGLIPVVVQDYLTGEVRMVAFATSDAVRMTLETGRATFWSRSRGQLWEKGLTSGNEVRVLRVLVDCDADCLIYVSDPVGNTCHTGSRSCFFQILNSDQTLASTSVPQTLLAELESILEARRTSATESSYTRRLYDSAPSGIAAKVREEADELARAVEAESDASVIHEAADLLYHLLVGLRWRRIGLRDVLAELMRRLGTSGLVEKASRR